MSETNGLTAPAEPAYGEPVQASDVTIPDPIDTGEPPEPAPPEPAPAKPTEPAPKPREDWRETRLRQQTARTAAEARRADEQASRAEAAERRLADLEAAAKPPGETPSGKVPTQAEIERLIETRAAERATQSAKEAAASEFNAECAKSAALGKSEYPDFDDKIGTMWTAIGAVKTDMVEAALETGSAHRVLYHLGANPEEAIRIAALPTEARRGAAIAKLATSLAAPKPVSKAPAPIEPVGGNARSEPGEQGPKDIGAWMAWDAERAKDRRR